jgi:hypothetical protein
MSEHHCKVKRGKWNIIAVLKPFFLIYFVSFTGFTSYNSKTYTCKAFRASSEMLAAGPCWKTRLLWNIRNSPENIRGGLCGVKAFILSCMNRSQKFMLLWIWITGRRWAWGEAQGQIIGGFLFSSEGAGPLRCCWNVHGSGPIWRIWATTSASSSHSSVSTQKYRLAAVD